ncbi:hypothetical protein [Sporosalibacterium faouarense]|uniref:hypothetical protein n=1 Tax=Sporosalibacterium faouarense TaxID=516123 RepID=UPI00192C412A|nr:hypothetical protein [Sporosalibacterium faouarense]
MRRRRTPKALIIAILIILVAVIGYIFYLLPKWVFFAFVGLVLIRVGWYLYDC